VVDTKDCIIGVVTDRDIVCRVVAEGKNPMAYTAETCMSQPVVTVNEDASLDEVVATMEKHQIRRVPVVDARGVCTGIISQADVAWVGPTRRSPTWFESVSRYYTRVTLIGSAAWTSLGALATVRRSRVASCVDICQPRGAGDGPLVFQARHSLRTPRLFSMSVSLSATPSSCATRSLNTKSQIVRQRDRVVHFTEYLVNAPPAWLNEFGPSAA
jgi:hypothetical protein